MPGEFPKLEEKYEKTIMDIINKKKLNLKEQIDLNILFEDFYKRHGTFSIFEEAKNPKFQIAINKVKKEEAEKQKKFQHYILNIESSSKPKQSIVSYYPSNSLFENEEETCPENIDNELRALADRLEKSRRNEMDFIRDQNKKWEQKKENDNLKFISSDEDDRQKEEKMKNFFLNYSIKENSFPNDLFIKFLNLMKKKKQVEYEKDPYIMNYRLNLESVYSSSHKWESDDPRKRIEDKSNDYFILMNKNVITSTNTNLTVTKEKRKKTIKKVEDIEQDSSTFEYGSDNFSSYEKSKVWKDFENDFNRFVKEQ